MTIGISSGFDLNSYLISLQGTAGKTTPGAYHPETPASPNVLQELVSAYAGLTSGASNPLFPNTDALSSLAGQGALAPLLGAIYAESMASGNAYFPTVGLSSPLEPSDSSNLLSTLSTQGLDGFSTRAISTLGTLALTAYANQQNGGYSTLTDFAKAEAAKIDLNDPASIQAAIQNAQANMLDLLF